jgi:glycine/D-amino acid oxidase-like deaminating enzyme
VSTDAPTLILGGGLMGLALAHTLARRGRAVTVISRRRQEAAGFVAAGMLAPHAEGLSGSLLQLGQLALEQVVFGPGTYLVPREDGLLVVGATVEPEAGFAAGLTPSGQRQLEAGLAELLPAAADWPPMERWWGFRPCTPDEAPLLGASPIPGLWLAAGHHRNGVLLAAITAELVGDLVLGRTPAADTARLLDAFRWNRFRPPGAEADPAPG